MPSSNDPSQQCSFLRPVVVTGPAGRKHSLSTSSAAASSSCSTPTDFEQSPTSPTSPTSCLSPDVAWNQHAGRLTVQHASHRPSQSIDSDTLRPRSNSYASTADTILRPRGNSEVDPITAAKKYDDVPLTEALTPDPRSEADFQIDDNRFAFSPGQLNKMQNPKSLAAYYALGGLQGLEQGLRTDLTAGLSVDESRLDGTVTFQQVAPSLDSRRPSTSKSPPESSPASVGPVSTSDGIPYEDRVRVFSQNILPARQSTGFFKLFWIAYNDKIIILLTIAAIVSLSLGIYETLDGGHGVEWVEGVAICVAILIVTVVTAANDWQKERQFAKLNKRNNDREVKVTRSGKSMMISIDDILVGDVLHLEPGDSIPADGVLISGHGIKCDESSATGESDQIKKTNGHEVWQQIIEGRATKKLDPFLISGSKVLEGVGTYLVTSVGPYSTYGRIMLSLQTTNDPTPLQVKLGRLADWIGYLGSAAAIVLFFILLFRFIANLPDHPNMSSTEKGKEFVDILIVAVTVIVVAIPEGLPLAVTLALAFATTRMVKENNLVRVLRACETMGNVTVICSDKTGTLTQNKMTVVACTWGSDQSFSRPSGTEISAGSRDISEVFQQCSAPVRDLIVKSVALNSTAFEETKDGRNEFVGSKTEVALLQLAQDYLGMDITSERWSADIVQLIPFDSARKCMGVVYLCPGVGYRLLVKGAAELMVDACIAQITENDVSKNKIYTEGLSEQHKLKILDIIDRYAQGSLRTIGMVYSDFAAWPPKDCKRIEDNPSLADFDDVFRDMTWIGVVGIQDPLRPEVAPAIRKCHRAGVQVKMVTGDNVNTATAIASSCGIKTEDGLVIEGPRFRQLSDEEMDQVIPRLQVLARSSPEDKRILVERLKLLGETVAVTGDGTNDGPALRTADVGFSMGIAGTEVAKEASSIILLDDNFRSIVTAISWGRAVNDSVAKFLQFQITVNITAVILTFVSSVYSSSNASVLNAVQLLWVNLIMDTFAALALATDAPTENILDRRPVPKSASLFTMTMWKMILGQTVYKLALSFMLYFAGDSLLDAHLSSEPELRAKQLSTVVFNTFVWMQIFNELNNRRLDNGFNVFEGILKNYWFMGINVVMVAGQIMIVLVGGAAFGVTRINGVLWAVCLVCAAGCLPWALVLRTIPDRHFGFVFNAVVDGTTFVLRPFIKGFKLISRGLRAFLQLVKRFTRRLLPRAQSKTDIFPDAVKSSDSPVIDEESPASNKLKKLDHSDSPSQEPKTPPSIVLPPVTVTTSLDSGLSPMPLGG